MVLKYDNIPIELKRLSKWVCWRYEGERQEKVPISPVTGRNASVRNPHTWASFEAARRFCEANHSRMRLEGIGFVFDGSGIGGIDLDGCIDPASGEIAEWAQEIIREINSYAETSPSGTGLKIFFRGALSGGAVSSKNIEIYDHARYFTVTGRHLPGTPTTVESRQEAVAALYAGLSGGKSPSSTGGGRGTPTQPVDVETAVGKLFRGAPKTQHEKLAEAIIGEWPRERTEGVDRSGAEYHLARSCAEAGLSEGETAAVVKMSAVHQAKFHSRGDEKTWLQKIVERATEAGRETEAEDIAAQLLSEARDHAEWVWDAPEPEELWEGVLFRGCVHLLAAPPKKGKSTFLGHLLDRLSGPEYVAVRVGGNVYALQDGTFLGRRFRGRNRILLVTENPPKFWHSRPVLPGVTVLSAFRVRAAGARAIPALIRSGRFDLVVVDSLDKAIPIEDENSNAEIVKNVGPIIEAAHEADVAVILVHHHRKGGGSGGDEIRGGSGLFGSVDEYWSLNRLDGGEENDDEPHRGVMRMVLSSTGRISTPCRIFFCCALSDAWLVEGAEVSASEKILAVIKEEENALSRKEITQKTGIPGSTVRRHLREFVERGVLEMVGTKKRPLYRCSAAH